MAHYECCNPDCDKTFDSAAVRDAHERTCEVKKQSKRKKK